MIALNKVNKYCCNDISLIENYNNAIEDMTQIYDCHHRLETDLNMSANELILKGLYYNRPAKELIFLTHAEHTKLHHKGKIITYKQRMNISLCTKTAMQKEEIREKISIGLKGKMAGKNNPMYGKNCEDYMTEEAILEKRRKVSETLKQKKWMTDGKDVIRVNINEVQKYLDQGYKLGRLKNEIN